MPLTRNWLLSLLLVTVSATMHAQSRSREEPDPIAGKVWAETTRDAAPGSLRIFLPDGTLVSTSCVETYRLSRWTRLAPTRISWQEDGARIDAEILQLSGSELKLRLRLVGGAREETFAAAAGPTTCPEPERKVPELTINGTVFYMERMILPASALVRVELRDDSRGNAAADPLAVQTMTAKEGPPFKYALKVPRDRVDARSRLSVFGEITDGGRVLFTTRNRYAVPQDGRSNVEVRLTPVSAPKDAGTPAVVMPAPTTYQCGDESFKVAFEAGRAYVTMPDRTVVTLQRLDQSRDPKATATYTNGRITFTQKPRGAGDPQIQFARGRRAPVTCSK